MGRVTAQTIPILPSPDFDERALFYAGLGFREEARFPGQYLILTHPTGIELHFWSNPALESHHNDAGCYVRFATAAEAVALHDRWAGSGLEPGHLRPPVETDYGLAEFALLDAHRNLVRVGGFIAAP